MGRGSTSFPGVDLWSLVVWIYLASLGSRVSEFEFLTDLSSLSDLFFVFLRFSEHAHTLSHTHTHVHTMNMGGHLQSCLSCVLRQPENETLDRLSCHVDPA